VFFVVLLGPWGGGAARGGWGLAIVDEDWSSTTQLSGAVVEISCT
jgi:hypothetical protein